MACITVVVLGHWLTTTVLWEPDRVTSVNALSVVPWTRAATWLVQVMPLVFFIGGFANASSLERHGGRYGAFLQNRLRRLLVPTWLFLALWMAAGLLIEAADPSAPGKAYAAEVAALPLWFLGIYLVVVAASPGLLHLHRRFSQATLIVLAALVAVVDLVSIGMGQEDLGGLNQAFVWLLAHQVGFAYADGSLLRSGRRTAVLMAAGGLAALLALTTVGGYPVSLVGVPGQLRSNAQPPSLAMLAQTIWLVGLALLLRPAVLRWMERVRVRGIVAGVQSAVLTIYVWHVTAIVGGGLAWHALGLPEPEIGTGSWWLLRPAWVLAALFPLALLVALFRRLEVHPLGPWPAFGPVRAAAAGFGVFALAIGLLGFGETGFFPVAPAVGESLLVFRFNPLLNVVHLAAGAPATLLRHDRAAVTSAVVGAIVFLALGILEVSGAGAADPFGMDRFTGWTHVVVGAATLAALGFSAARRR